MKNLKWISLCYFWYFKFIYYFRGCWSLWTKWMPVPWNVFERCQIKQISMSVSRMLHSRSAKLCLWYVYKFSNQAARNNSFFVCSFSGNDGVTYESLCHLHQASCLLQKPIIFDYDGHCSKHQKGWKNVQIFMKRFLIFRKVQGMSIWINLLQRPM